MENVWAYLRLPNFDQNGYRMANFMAKTFTN